jgi:transcription factor IIIB subunit 2
VDVFAFIAKGDQQETGTTSKSRKVRISLAEKTFHDFICFIYLCCFVVAYFLTLPPQRRKTNNKPRDASTPHGSTTAESVRNLIKKNPKYSKRINYDALKDLFVDGGVPGSFKLPMNMGLGMDDKDDDDLYTIGADDKSDGDGGMGMVVIQEEPGTVSVAPVPAASGPRPRLPELEEDDVDADEGSEKGDDVGWEDAYEQEV